MENNTIKNSFYLRVSILLVGICALGAIVFLGQAILLPLCYSLLFAILLDPAVMLLLRIKFPRIIAIAVVVLSAMAVTLLLIYFISSQVASFSSSLPEFKAKGAAMLTQAEGWMASVFHTSQSNIHSRVSVAIKSLMNNKQTIMGSTLSTVSGLLFGAILVPVYTFMILYYKNLFLGFITKVFQKNNHAMVGEVMLQGRVMIHQYLIGLLLEAIIVATLNSLALIVIGIKYAILIGVIGALLNVIPLIGGIVAVGLPVLMAVITKDSFTPAIFVTISYIAIQFLDNHFLIPKIVASRVKINALVSIVVVLMFGALCGIAGMFLAIPLTAVIKIIFDRIDPLKPWGYLLGDDIEPFNGFGKLFKVRKK